MIANSAIMGNSGVGVGDAVAVGAREDVAVDVAVAVGVGLVEEGGVDEADEDAEVAVTVPLTTVAVINCEVPPEPGVT